MYNNNPILTYYSEFKSVNDLINLCFDIINIKSEKNNLVYNRSMFRISDFDLLQSINLMLDKYVNKYGYLYKCYNIANCFLILDDAIKTLYNLLNSKIQQEMIKDFCKKLCYGF